MRKNVIYAQLWENGWYMDFLYKGGHQISYLFSMRYRKKIYEYFRFGKSIEQLQRCKDWKKNRQLIKLVKVRIPLAIKSVIL